jgi:biopolymer transport protein TolR
MARTFRRQRASHPIADLNVTNLVDLGFTLLIIFMIATPLINQEQTIPVNLPVESKSSQSKPDKDTRFVSISIDGKGQYYLDNLNRPITFRELQARLVQLGAEKKEPVVRIRADAKIPYEKVIQIMDELKKNNLSKITFDTQADS